jgi:hypothetical protein
VALLKKIVKKEKYETLENIFYSVNKNQNDSDSIPHLTSSDESDSNVENYQQ